MFTKTKLAISALAALAVITVAMHTHASPLGGSWCRKGSVDGGRFENYSEYFQAGQIAVVAMHGDGYTDLDLYIYDEFGNLIEADTSGGDTCQVSFRPHWSGHFTIKVVNRGAGGNNYTICVY
ncbi:MAG: hypothetical protein RIC55_21710 [Pirellulaceae bacterium]